MVKLLLTRLLLLLCLLAHVPSVQGEEAELPRSYKVSRIKSLVINSNGAYSGNCSGDIVPEACQEFRLTEQDVKAFFKVARRIAHGQYNDLPCSNCYVDGNITFANGDKGYWRIDAFARAYIVLEDDRGAYFYGERANPKPFGGEIPSLASYRAERFTRIKEPKPIKTLKAVKSITIYKDNFQWWVSDKQKAGQCEFVMNECEVRDFFQRAKITTVQGVNLGGGECHLEGEVEFMDGDKGTWMIQSNRTGVMEARSIGKVFFLNKNPQGKGFD